MFSLFMIDSARHDINVVHGDVHHAQGCDGTDSIDATAAFRFDHERISLPEDAEAVSGAVGGTGEVYWLDIRCCQVLS